jgi:peptidoglycan/LPS O-acetylase OafA/YrhL
MHSLIPFQEISTISIWIPLIIAAFRLKAGGVKLILFFIFLSTGAIVDGIGWGMNLIQSNTFLLPLILYFYLFFEALFFVWVSFEFLNEENVKKWRKRIFFCLMILFLIRGYVVFFSRLDPTTIVSYIDTGTMVLCAFLFAFALMKLAESESNLMQNPWFWILSGMFFYSFGTFFVDLIVSTEAGGALWPIRNVVNIIQYGFFVVGLLKMPRRGVAKI